MGFFKRDINQEPFNRNDTPEKKAKDFDNQIKQNAKAADKKDREAEKRAAEGDFIPLTPRGRQGTGRHRKS